ncbi:O-antigen ligase family protein [Peribacillus simplex]|uniref:O-antigen ligase family protein n=1 Tax=Peribacillus simplex TaxID=1478 RepID=UPI0010BEC19C|nr:O-antigen ligase family protein [Peribacillus simplex]TKH00647.1 O-antigen ligase family protein [Peribacillus simplex]
MNNSLNVRSTIDQKNNFFTIIIITMVIFLNQSNIIFGTNISFADFFCIIALLALAYKNRLLFPIAPTVFFLFLSAFLLICSVFYVPIKFSYYTEPFNVMVNYMKLMMTFLYFIVGYSLISESLITKSLKWYSNFSLIIGVVGIVFIIFKINIFSEMLFFGNRFKGLMNDPNYFSIIQISSLVYFSRIKNIKVINRRLAVSLSVISILASGSKTGLITLLGYIIFRVVESIFKSKMKLKSLIINILVIIIIIFIVFNFSSLLQNLLESASSIIPAFSRVEFLLTDFNSAVTESGSGRDTAWKVAIEIIKLSPLMGVGIGTYSGIAEKLFGTNVIAHNTYLQLFSEWGILLSTILFLYIFYIIGKVTFNKKMNTEINCILRDILFVFLIGSLAISLNNARMVWFFLGIIAFSIKYGKKKGENN